MGIGEKVVQDLLQVTRVSVDPALRGHIEVKLTLAFMRDQLEILRQISNECGEIKVTILEDDAPLFCFGDEQQLFGHVGEAA